MKMTEKQQIKEMQKIMEHCCNVYDDKGNHIRNKCNTWDCEYYCDTNNVCCSFSLKEATALYKAGCRIIPQDAVVLTVEELNEKQDIAWRRGKKQGRKETVRSFAEKLKKRLFEFQTWNMPYDEFCKGNVVCGEIDELAKQYEVELD